MTVPAPTAIAMFVSVLLLCLCGVPQAAAAAGPHSYSPPRRLSVFGRAALPSRLSFSHQAAPAQRAAALPEDASSSAYSCPVTLSLSPAPALLGLRGGFNVNVRTLSGRTIALELEPDESVESLKAKIRDKEGIPAEQQRLIFGAKHLDPLKAVSDYGIEADSTLNLVLRLRGGRARSS
jgi:hypothetical protein